MKDFKETPEKGKEFAGEFISMLAGNEETQHWADADNNELQALADYVNGINNANIEEGVKESLKNRIEYFMRAVLYAKKLADPELTDEAKIKTNLEAFTACFNEAVKNENTLSPDKTLAGDISKLLNGVDHSIVDAPQVKALWNMVSMATKAEGLADTKQTEMKLDELDVKIADFNKDKNAFIKKFNGVVVNMHKISPEMTAFELIGRVETAKKDSIFAQGELETFNKLENINLRRVKRMEVQTQVANKRREIEEARENISILREKERVMEKEATPLKNLC